MKQMIQVCEQTKQFFFLKIDFTPLIALKSKLAERAKNYDHVDWLIWQTFRICLKKSPLSDLAW